MTRGGDQVQDPLPARYWLALDSAGTYTSIPPNSKEHFGLWAFQRTAQAWPVGFCWQRQK